MHDSRLLLIRALLLDALGQLLILFLILVWPIGTTVAFSLRALQGQMPWLLFMLLLYPFLGWLFGSYTVLRWRRLVLPVLLQRLFLTALATLMVVAIARWLFNPNEEVWLVYRSVQVVWLTGLTFWALLVRWGMRGGLLVPEIPCLLLLASPSEELTILRAWHRVPHRQRLRPTTPQALKRRLEHREQPLLVALSSKRRMDPSVRSLLDQLEISDPHQVRVVSPISLFQQQQERLPPALMDDNLLSYDDLPWVASFSVQAQLKRLADLVVAVVLLLLTAPFIALAALMIWFEDQGPIFYVQERSGWLGRPFYVYKLRTMSVQPVDAPAQWTQLGDRRITLVGSFLRRLRLDELPQLLNVLNGEMSLIGPRPERPEHEDDLVRRIPHYRKRHWMRPGLSGWAQVCAPYASSIEDSDLKLSYDLYYLRYFSTWMDLVILFRTIKTVLKASGR